jgi:AcrR family transcriptional regulator
MGTARVLFAERGYAGVSADDIVASAGLTRGALHHHFGDKAGLFRAVFEELEAELAEEIAAAVGGADPAARMLVGLGAFLDICQRPDVRQIALTDAPTVLGWETWRAIESEHGLRLIKELISESGADGPVDVAAQLVLSVLIEAGLMIANGADRASVEQTLLTLLSGA